MIELEAIMETAESSEGKELPISERGEELTDNWQDEMYDKLEGGPWSDLELELPDPDSRNRSIEESEEDYEALSDDRTIFEDGSIETMPPDKRMEEIYAKLEDGPWADAESVQLESEIEAYPSDGLWGDSEEILAGEDSLLDEMLCKDGLPSEMQDLKADLDGTSKEHAQGHTEEGAKEDSNAEGEAEQAHEPNSRYREGENVYETDDNGNPYKKNGELMPNTEYTVNGYTYCTNEHGNIISCDGKAELNEKKRNIDAQREAGGEDRREGDEGGHLIARIFGGSGGKENLVPLRGSINRSEYKQMENTIADSLDQQKDVDVHIDVEYDEDSSRPSKIKVTTTIDGEKTEYSFDNEEGSTELADSLEGVLSPEDYDGLKSELEAAREDGHLVSVTSVEVNYDENGNPTDVTVTIRDETEGTKTTSVFSAQSQ